MTEAKETVLVTGAAGNLGVRLLRQLNDFNVIAADVSLPPPGTGVRFERVDLEHEASCRQLIDLICLNNVSMVVHLAFVIDPVRTNILDTGRMWQINVAGTARVMEAITEVHRRGGRVRKFIFPSSVSAYGSDLAAPAKEDSPLTAHTLPYAVHKREADEVVRFRAESLGECSTYLLRPHIFAGATMQNYLIGVLRGTATGRGKLAATVQRKGWRLPLIAPFGRSYRHKQFQFVHVDDMARLIAWILRRPEDWPHTTILNVAGRGAPLELQQCVEIAHQKMVRLPGRWACRAVLRLLWKLGICGVPPEALPYMIGSYPMDTSRLQAFLGKDYRQVIQFTVEQALQDSFHV